MLREHTFVFKGVAVPAVYSYITKKEGRSRRPPEGSWNGAGRQPPLTAAFSWLPAENFGTVVAAI